MKKLYLCRNIILGMKQLRDFVDLLDRENQLIRVKEFVSRDLEMAEINDRMVKNGGKALLFENNETKFPVLLNMYGSQERIAMALRVDKLEDFTHRIDSLFKDAMSPKRTLLDKLKLLPLLKDASTWMPRNRSFKGRCQDVVIQGENINLYDLPIIKSAPCDAAPFVTLPMVNTLDPESGARNVGMYRMQVLSKNSTALHWHKHKSGEKHYQKYKAQGERMPVAVCLGGDPAYTYSATAPLPDGIDEYILSGFIRNQSVNLVKCISNDLRVPEDCDFVIEGYVDTMQEKIIEGPFGDHTGFYSLEDYYPVFHITAITHRSDAIYPATVVGIPPQEDAYIGMATERIFLSPIKAILQPEIKDMFLPFEGVAHNLAIFDIEKSFQGQGLKSASAMWGAGQMMFNKFIITLSGQEQRITQANSLKHQLRDMNISEAVMTTKGPLDVLDHNAPVCGFGGKMCIDLTERCDGEMPLVERKVVVPSEIKHTQGVTHFNVNYARDGWSVLAITIDRTLSDYASIADNFLRENKIEGINIVVVFDEEHNLESTSTLMWIAGNNIDPVRDCVNLNQRLLVFDSRSKFQNANFKREWPNVVTQSMEVIERVDKMWPKLGAGEFIESPSLQYMELKFNDNASV